MFNLRRYKWTRGSEEGGSRRKIRGIIAGRESITISWSRGRRVAHINVNSIFCFLGLLRDFRQIELLEHFRPFCVQLERRMVIVSN